MLSCIILDPCLLVLTKGFPGGSDGKESSCNVGDPSSIPGLGRSPDPLTLVTTNLFYVSDFILFKFHV